MKTEVPIYMKLSDQCFTFGNFQHKIDKDILIKVQALKFNFHGYSD